MKEYKVKVFEDKTEWRNLNGQLHREDNAPAIEYNNGDNEWYQNGKRHRENAPAIDYINGDKHWFLNGKRHREDGPAIEYNNGIKLWYLNNNGYTEEQFKNKVKKIKELTVKEITELLGYNIKIIK